MSSPQAIPTNVGYGRVTGRFGLTASDGTTFLPAAELSITFTPAVAALIDRQADPAPLALGIRAVYCTIDGLGYLTGPNGSAGVSLIATDDEDLSPNQWSYHVRFLLKGVAAPFSDFELLVAQGTTVDLGDVIPASASTGVSITVAAAAEQHAALSAAAAAASASSAGTAASTATAAAALVAGVAANAAAAASSATGSAGSATAAAESATNAAGSATGAATAAVAAVAAAPTVVAAAASAVAGAFSDASLAIPKIFATDSPAFSVVDSAGKRSWIETGPDGHPTAAAAALIDAAISPTEVVRTAAAIAALPVAQTIGEGPSLAYVVVDNAGHKSELQIDLTGKIVGPFIDRVSVIAAAAGAAAAASVVQTATVPITCWGDSMTAAGSGYSDLLAAEIGGSVVVQAFAIGGQGSQQIAARQGGFPALCRCPSDTIPASGPVTLDSISTTLYSNTSSTGTVTGHGTLANIPGVLSRTYPGTAFVFTRDTPGTAIWCPPTAPWISDIATANRGYITCIWSGRNSLLTTAGTDILYLIQMMVNYLDSASKRFLILEVTPLDVEINGSANRITLDALNALLQKTWPYAFVPIGQYARGPMLADAGITPTAQDTTDLGNGVTPLSLRNDNTHFNLAGRTLVARMVSNTLKTKGWV